MSFNLKKWALPIFLGVVSGSITNILWVYAPFLPKLWEHIGPVWWFVLPITFSIIFILLGYIHGAGTRKGSLIAVGYRRPMSVLDEGKVNKFDVKWEAIWGYSTRFPIPYDKPYVYIEGPFCPVCRTELDGTEKSKLFGWIIQRVWHCATCDKDYKRPTKYLYREEAAVKRIAEARFKAKRK